MKLLVIILCLLSERFLIHRCSNHRFKWFPSYVNFLNHYLLVEKQIHPVLAIFLIVLPIFIITGLIIFLFDPLLFGFIGFLLSLVIFYYCLGPENPFYPSKIEGVQNEEEVGIFFNKVNGQLFAVIFWYILTGPLGIIVYRLVSLCCEFTLTMPLAARLTQLFDWIPARITALLYLLVGNFQRGFPYLIKGFFTSPENNANFLGGCGILAAKTNEHEPLSLPYAESLMEHALIVYLVFLACFTLVAWL